MAILPPAVEGGGRAPRSSRATLELIGAPGEAERDPSFQHELARTEDALRNTGMSLQSQIRFQKSTSGGSWLTGEFLLQLIELADAPVAAILTAWLTARLGRKVRIKVGDIEAEASTPEQVERLLEKAIAIHERASEARERVDDDRQ